MPTPLLLLLTALSCRPETPVDSGVETLRCEATSTERVRTWSTDELLADDLTWDDYPGNRGPGLGLGDLDGDGDLDLLVTLPIGHSLVMTNDGAGHLAIDDRWTVDDGPLPEAIGVALADLDGDGDLDAVLARKRNVPDLVLWNQGGSFTRESLPDSEGESRSVAVGDADADGDLDLVITGFHPSVNGDKVQTEGLVGDGNGLYLRSGDSWVNASERIPEPQRSAFTYQATFIDVDGDHDQDLYLDNDFGPLYAPNALLRNDGAGGFTLDHSCSCDVSIAGMGTAIADTNGDGLPDFYLSDTGTNHLLESARDGGWVDVTLAREATPSTAGREYVKSWGVAVADLDQDSRQDFVLAYGNDPDETLYWRERDAILMGDRDGTFRDAGDPLGFSDEPGISRTVVTGDLDGDGRTDVLVGGLLWLEQWHLRGGCPPGVRVVLDGPPENAQGLGARVQLTRDDTVQTRWMVLDSTSSSHAPELIFGLGPYLDADQVAVDWPDGTRTAVGPVPGGATVELAW